MNNQPNNQPNKKPGWLQVVRDQAWGTLFGFLLTILTIILVLEAWPQARQTLSQVLGSTPTPTPTAALTPSPTPTPVFVTINQTMSCTDCVPNGPGSGNFSLNIKSATIDRAHSKVTLLIGVQNESTGDVYGVEFYYLKLQDTQTGVTTDGREDGFKPSDFSVNQLKLFSPTFYFVPTGHEYSLSAEISISDWLHLFSPITIKFFG